MMESSNNLNLDLYHHHHHHHQEELHGSSSSSYFNFVGRDQEWINQDHLLMNNIGGDHYFHSNPNVGSILTSHELMMAPSGVQDLGLQWAPLLLNGSDQGYYNMMNNNNNHHSTSTPSSSPSSSPSSHQLARFPKQYDIKEELPLGLINSNYYCHQINGGLHDHDHQPMFGPSPGSGSFGVVLPTANIASSMMSYGMDHFHSLSNQPSLLNDSICNMASFLRGDLGYPTTLSQLQAQAVHHKISSHSALSGVTEAKRASSSGDSRTSQSIAKKPRFESRSSFTPFKVRKEKLGDRIAALQQLVAPFGKTDTASVLMEAIGYIKFLQDQVETLSVPYMRSSNNKKLRASQGASNEEKDEAKPDLRSRGLCLVPLSCTSYVTNENGGVWSSPNYRGGT